MGTKSKILIVEWDTSKAEILWDEIQQSGHEPLVAFSVQRATLLIAQEHPHAVLLRWRMPDASALSLIDDLRRHVTTSRLPIIVLGEQDAGEDECIRALEAGAHDYVKGPYGTRELLARIGVALRPVSYRNARNEVSIGLLTMDLDARRAFARTAPDADEVDLRLGPTSYRLLRFFIENTHKVLSRKEIIDSIWLGRSVHEGIVDVYVKSLRATLQPMRKSLAIETVRGAGFRLSSVVAAPQPPRPAVGSPRLGKCSLTGGRPHNSATRNEPVLVSDLNAAIEKIRRLKDLLHEAAEENRLLRDEFEATQSAASDNRGPVPP
jgi:two-component system phosphate regulon response regulator PhoB